MAYGRESRIILNNLAYQATEKSRLAKVEEAALYLTKMSNDGIFVAKLISKFLEITFH